MVGTGDGVRRPVLLIAASSTHGRVPVGVFRRHRARPLQDKKVRVLQRHDSSLAMGMCRSNAQCRRRSKQPFSATQCIGSR